jgi:hypothetical protein
MSWSTNSREIFEVKSRLEKYYDIKHLKIRSFKGVTYIFYLDGPPEWFIGSILHGLKTYIKREISGETMGQLFLQNPPAGINKAIWLKNRIFATNWYSLKTWEQ